MVEYFNVQLKRDKYIEHYVCKKGFEMYPYCNSKSSENKMYL